MVAYPEMHLFGAQSTAELEDAAEPLTGPRVKALAELAGDLGIWLLPGSLCDADVPGAV
jgi:predicted amidohydrolase